ncbi:MAG: hypothetical protein U0R69_13435 [Gaiellales bacterium]
MAPTAWPGRRPEASEPRQRETDAHARGARKRRRTSARCARSGTTSPPGRRELLRALAEDQRRLSELERLESPSTQRRLDRVRALEAEVVALRSELERWQRSSRELEARTAHLEEQLARVRVRNESTDDESPERPANERID